MNTNKLSRIRFVAHIFHSRSGSIKIVLVSCCSINSKLHNSHYINHASFSLNKEPALQLRDAPIRKKRERDNGRDGDCGCEKMLLMMIMLSSCLLLVPKAAVMVASEQTSSISLACKHDGLVRARAAKRATCLTTSQTVALVEAKQMQQC